MQPGVQSKHPVGATNSQPGGQPSSAGQPVGAHPRYGPPPQMQLMSQPVPHSAQKSDGQEHP